MRHTGTMLLVMVTLVTLILGPTATAQNDHERPDMYPGVWYKIVFDENGDTIVSSGDGDGWHYYSTSDTYRMWFYNAPYDPNRKGYLNYEVYIKAVDANETTYASVHFCWSTPEWSALNTGGPPTSSDVPTINDEFLYISSEHLHTVDNLKIGTVEPVRSHTIRGYNPEWVGIEITGRNAYIYRGAWHECLDKQEGDDDNYNDTLNVCCNRTTGHCYTIFGGKCAEGYETLDEGQTCDDCIKASEASLDFGDAPDPTYPTHAGSNGARHTVLPGIFLGKGVDAEVNGQPNDTATGDDENGSDEDGVVFLSALQSGALTDIEVTASVEGYLNAWVDFNGNGSFDGGNEQIFTDEVLAAGVNPLTFNVPSTALIGVTYARFRFNTRGLLDADGLASDGEVEDYAIEIVKTYGPYPTSGLTRAKWNQPPAAIDTAAPFFFNGIGALSSLTLHQIAADDLQFDDSLPVTGIHWWGTFNNWTESYLPIVTPLAFHIGIWTDEADAGSKMSNHPGTLLWESYCTDWKWALAGYQQNSQSAELGETCFQFSHLLSQDQWFLPPAESTGEGSNPAFYWVSIASFYDPEDAQPEYEWGWLSRPQANGQSAMMIETVTDSGSSDRAWPPTIDSQWFQGAVIQDTSGAPSDLAFQVTTYASFDEGKNSSTGDAGQNKSKSLASLADLALQAQSWLDTLP